MVLSGIAIPRPRKPEVGKNLHKPDGPGGEKESSMTGPLHCPLSELGKSQPAFVSDFVCIVSLINQLISTSSVTQHLTHNPIPLIPTSILARIAFIRPTFLPRTTIKAR